MYRKKKEQQRKKEARENDAPLSDQKVKKSVRTGNQIRKQTQRVRKSLPENSKGWAATVNHLIKTASPRRKSMIKLNEEQSEIRTVLGTNKKGRPRTSNTEVKRKLAMTDTSDQLWSSKSLGQYRRRKQVQVKRLKKVSVFQRAWKSKLDSFLEDHSRVMPNKKDTILIDGTPVAKRHLLITKKELFKKFKQQTPSFNRKFTTFQKLIPKQYRT